MEQHLTGALAENGISLWGGSIPELELKLELLGGDLIQRVRGGRVGESEITCNLELAFQDENETETRLGCFYATTVHVTWALALPLLGEDDTVRYVLI